MSPSAAARLDALVDRVVASGCCTGCGMCAQLDAGLELALDDHGFARPRRVRASTADDAAVRAFRAACPGMTVRAQHHPDAVYDPQLGPVLGVWEAAASDPEIRRRGSSGGVLTALAAWATSTGEVAQVIGARAGDDPRRTVSVTIQTRREALESAGSRYAPASAAAHPLATDPGGATIGKPCEAAALRALAGARGAQAPLLLSFFCAGTPSAHATDALVEQLGVAAGTVPDELWYRGRGWPGRFTVRAGGDEVSASYEESWGGVLGPAVQWRCRTCPDGIGESSDVTAGDFWRADERGYPVFDESDGWSALVARTPRGLDLVERAIAAGVLMVRPITPREVMAVQPSQRKRRRTLAGRLLGARLAGARVPRYRGFGLLRLASQHARESVRTARGTFRRVRSGALRRSA